MTPALFAALMRDDWVAVEDLVHICRAVQQEVALAQTLVRHKYAYEVYDRSARPALLYYAQGVSALVDWSLTGQGWAVVDADTVRAYDQCLACGEDLSACWGPITYCPVPWDPEYRTALCEACGTAAWAQYDGDGHRWRRVPSLGTAAGQPPVATAVSPRTSHGRDDVLRALPFVCFMIGLFIALLYL